jgi:hypothetical protein
MPAAAAAICCDVESSVDVVGDGIVVLKDEIAEVEFEAGARSLLSRTEKSRADIFHVKGGGAGTSQLWTLGIVESLRVLDQKMFRRQEDVACDVACDVKKAI